VLPPGPGLPDEEAARPADVTPATDPDLLPDEPDLDAGAAPAAQPTGVSATRPAPEPALAAAPIPAPAASVDGDDDFAEPSTSEAAGVSATSPQAP
ncbi:hypothetical protein ABZX77_49905, partial [Streptomyces sp. NPDC004237]